MNELYQKNENDSIRSGSEIIRTSVYGTLAERKNQKQSDYIFSFD